LKKRLYLLLIFPLIFTSSNIEKFDRYRQAYALAGLCEMFILSLVLTPVFALDMDDEGDHKSDKSAGDLSKFRIYPQIKIFRSPS
jgi:hypothetical protein